MLRTFSARHRARPRTLALAAAAWLLAAMGCQAQTSVPPAFPGKPVRIITPFPVGGGPDGVARLLADGLARRWGQPVTVENRPGGNGFIAIEAFRRAPQDGTTLIVLDGVHWTAYPQLFRSLPYDPDRDLLSLLPLFKTYFFVTVGQHSPYRNMRELLEDARTHPGLRHYGSWSIGNPVHLGTEWLGTLSGAQMEHVVFKETSLLYTAVASGDLDFALGSAATAGPLQRTGKLRFLAIAAPQRAADYPEVPTVSESGGPKDFEVMGWNALAVPPSLPTAVADQIRRDAAAVLLEPTVQAKFQSFAYTPFPLSGRAFTRYIASERQRWGTVMQRARIRLD